MFKKLKDCNIGDYVILWCIGWNDWDTDCVKVIDKDVLITVQYRNGSTGRFSTDTDCKIVGF